MTNAVFVGGFMLAVLVILVLAIVWQWAKSSLRSWGYDLTRETHSLLRDTHLKLDSIKYQQERLLSGLESLERTARTHTTTLNGLRSKTAV